jgi:hypothetical protein
MKRAVAVLLFFVAAGGLAIGRARQAPPNTARTVVLTGVLTDTMCRTAPHDASMKSAAECIQRCVNSGSHYALVSDGKVYTLKGADTALQPYAGKSVTVHGTANAYQITVTSVEAPQSAQSAH